MLYKEIKVKKKPDTFGFVNEKQVASIFICIRMYFKHNNLILSYGIMLHNC